VARHGADVLFDGPHDQERWDVRWRQGEATTDPFEFHAAKKSPAEPLDTPAPAVRRSDTYVILTVQRNRRVAPMARSVTLRSGDRAAIVLYSRAKPQAIAELASLGWHPLPADALLEETDITTFSAPP
jgi:hypothetical protein